MRRATVPLLALTALCCSAPVLCVAQCADADLILRHGKFVTMNDAGDVAEAMAIRDGKILAVGSDAALAGCASARTKVLDLNGRTVLPGLIDVHTHALEWAMTSMGAQVEISYQSVKSIAEIAERVRRRAQTAKPGEWITGFGWDEDKLAERRYMTRADMDAVAPNNPVYLGHRTGHLAIVNSAALRMANVMRASKDPQGGEI